VERIEPIRPHLPSAEPIPKIRRSESATDKREQEREPGGRKPPRKPHREPPPEDGRPHIDVTV
jgi:hypothetical protein